MVDYGLGRHQAVSHHTTKETVMVQMINTRAQSPAPVGSDGTPVEPEPFFDDWDPTPHAHFIVDAEGVKLGDVVFASHQVDGIGQAEQRGAPARRLDLAYVVGASTQPTARAILPLDQTLRVKRYLPAPGGHDWAFVQLNERVEGKQYPAGLVPDYGHDVQRCCGPEENPHGYDEGATMCDECAPSWALDHQVVRHQR